MPGTDRTKKAGGWKTRCWPNRRHRLDRRGRGLDRILVGRSLAAWIGLVPRQTGGKERLRRIPKQGNRYLRWLLVADPMAVIRYARQHGTERLASFV
jgi:transposase